MKIKHLIATFLAAVAFTACDSTIMEPQSPEELEALRRATALETTPMQLLTGLVQQASISAATVNGVTEYTITTAGNDPRVFAVTNSLNTAIDEEQHVLSFEYKTSTGIEGDLQIFFAKVYRSWTNSYSSNTNGVSNMEDYSLRFKGYDKVVTEWTKVEIDLKEFRTNHGNWGVSKPGSRYYWSLWFDIGNVANSNFMMRNIQFRSMTEEELAEQAEREQFSQDKIAYAQRIDDYLNASFASQVTQVEVTSTEVIVRGITSGSGRFAVAEVTPYENITEMETFPHLTAVRSSDFAIRLPRYVDRDGFNYDRLLSKWAIVSLDDGKQTLASHARYADKVKAKRSPVELASPPNKKGILGVGIHSLDETNDFNEMGLGLSSASAHINTWLMTRPLRTSYGNGNSTYDPTKFEYGGRTYYISGAAIADNDVKVRKFNQSNMMVFAYIEIWPTGTSAPTFDEDIIPIIYHPERDGGNQLFPNVTTPEAVNAYAAFLEFYIDRYTQQGQRIHHFIAHNEVNAHEAWANMGKGQPELYFMDAYLKSMHMIYNILRQYDQNASVMNCVTHDWSVAGSSDCRFSTLSMLSNMKRFEAAEGEIYWGLSHHPYPYTSKPDFWNYDGNYVNFTQSSPYVTFYNLEVLNDWALNPDNFYNGKKRPVYLLEQGVNSADNSAANQKLQAAGLAWVWKKVQGLSGIDGIAYYAWVDGNDEGLQLGLRRDEANGYAKKESWYVWKAAGTSNEESVFAPYLSVCGLTDWSQVMH